MVAGVYNTVIEYNLIDMVDLPSNVVPYLIGFPVFLFFGLRGFMNYRRVHNPLSLYFGWAGLTAGLAFFFFSVPFAFTNNETAMTVFSIIGDFFLYVMLVIQASLVHYLALKNRVSGAVMLVPALILAITGWAAHIFGYIHNGVAIVDGVFEYQLPLIASVIQIILLVNVFLVGILLLTRIKQQPNARGKSALFGISVLYILSAAGGALNIILSGKPNESPAIIGSYIGGFVLFVGILLAVRFLKNKKTS